MSLDRLQLALGLPIQHLCSQRIAYIFAPGGALGLIQIAEESARTQVTTSPGTFPRRPKRHGLQAGRGTDISHPWLAFWRTAWTLLQSTCPEAFSDTGLVTFAVLVKFLQAVAPMQRKIADMVGVIAVGPLHSTLATETRHVALISAGSG